MRLNLYAVWKLFFKPHLMPYYWVRKINLTLLRMLLVMNMTALCMVVL